uniref:AB hydrolase-1 domain-containing protein n=1 Tax=Calcidiscus leptoporus TaxID=127549 RepID=A0A7S0JH96_9EUKA|mmetsp:Transcript_58827/g.134934  ORF Transcript_58827/g.134934 Transcript_58827/m.134934 type:complete len:173 (+) Transcript_58827:24-542(+)
MNHDSGAADVSALVLTSPPQWEEMVSAVPEEELRRNFGALASAPGSAAIALLERRAFVRFFSNRFLFEREADEAWLDQACRLTGPSLRPPVAAFNAGLLRARSFDDELRRVTQPTLVLSGAADQRAAGRRPYARCMRGAELRTLPGLNVLPWEAPKETASAIHAFIAGDETG